ncbi:GD24239 [Drosophila simulans]|uniref:GD24239 n=1 Tax=Drosophila simulans TaxID=7240 RepID=B4QAG3_DROSI|nr:GD24239 [Drosophila simulans]
MKFKKGTCGPGFRYPSVGAAYRYVCVGDQLYNNLANSDSSEWQAASTALNQCVPDPLTSLQQQQDGQQKWKEA